MFGLGKALERGQFREFDRRGPVLVEIDERAEQLSRLADDYRLFGGTLRAVLIPHRRDGRELVDVEVDYARWKVVVGTLPEEIAQEFYRPLRKLERKGTAAMCVATIESTGTRRAKRASGYEVWLNPAA